MSKNVILKQNNETIFPVTKYENIIDAPDINEVGSSIHVGDTEPEVKTKL